MPLAGDRTAAAHKRKIWAHDPKRLKKLQEKPLMKKEGLVFYLNFNIIFVPTGSQFQSGSGSGIDRNISKYINNC